MNLGVVGKGGLTPFKRGGLVVVCTFLASLLVAGCSPLRLLSAVSPNGDVRTQAGLVYDAERDLRLDIHVPKSAASAPLPVIVFFYGGGWESGARAKYAFVASSLAQRGYVVVIPDYRLYPEVRFPAFIEDAADAVQWVGRNIRAYGGDPGRIVLAGHSAGAHIAALLNFDESWLAGRASARHCAFVGLSGPYDFLPIVGAKLQEIFPEPTREASQPIRFVDGSEPPALLIHGVQDRTVKPRNSAGLAEKIAAAGGQSKLITYPGRSHASIVLSLATPLNRLAPVADDVDGFVREVCPGA